MKSHCFHTISFFFMSHYSIQWRYDELKTKTICHGVRDLISPPTKILPVIKFITNCGISQMSCSPTDRSTDVLSLSFILAFVKQEATRIIYLWSRQDVNSLHRIFHRSVELSHRARTSWKKHLTCDARWENMQCVDNMMPWYSLISV